MSAMVVLIICITTFQSSLVIITIIHMHHTGNSPYFLFQSFEVDNNCKLILVKESAGRLKPLL